MSRILLTGASGFVGRFCYSLLKKYGYEVIPIGYRNVYKNTTDSNLLECDLLDKYTRDSLLGEYKPDYLLHLAWDVKPGYQNSDNNLFWFNASIDLVQSFYKNGGKFALTVGSCFEYNLYNKNDKICEFTTELNPDTIYGQCKKQMYEYLQLWTQFYGYKYCHARLFYLYGPYEFPNRFLPSIINGLLNNNLVELGSGIQIRDFLYVEDVASAIVAILNSKPSSHVINIGSGDGQSLKDFALFTAKLMGANSTLLKFGAKDNSRDPLNIVADTYILNNLFEWEPTFSLEEGLTKTIEYWRNKNGI